MKFILAFTLSFIFSQAFSQLIIISGKVVNAETGAPMQGASVFAQNTTLGTSTDNSGNFKLYLPEGGYDIIVTFTGFNSASKRITTSDMNDRDLSFQLKLEEKQMADIAVVSTSEVKDGWEKYGDFFLSEFIGNTENSALCMIKNKETLRFFYYKRKNRLKVISDVPVIIENNALGYNIRYKLDSFTHEYATKVSVSSGSPLFEEMVTSDLNQLQKWSDARNKAYNGSILHFMRSIYNRELTGNGFEVQFIVNVNESEQAVKVTDFYSAMNYAKDDSTQTVEIKPNQQNVGVIYIKEKPSSEYLKSRENEPSGFQYSMLNFLPGESIIIEKNGYYFEQNDITINAYWTWEKVADLLPYDYQPVISAHTENTQ